MQRNPVTLKPFDFNAYGSRTFRKPSDLFRSSVPSRVDAVMLSSTLVPVVAVMPSTGLQAKDCKLQHWVLFAARNTAKIYPKTLIGSWTIAGFCE